MVLDLPLSESPDEECWICLKKGSVNKKNHNQAINNILLTFQELGYKYFIRELCFLVGITEFGAFFSFAKLTILLGTTDK